MNILIVDDDAFIVEIFQKMLEEVACDIHTESTADAAIDYLEAGATCDFVITDIVMPGRDGTKLAQYVKANREDVPVLAVTSGMENAVDDYVFYAEMFADKVLKKPVEKQDLLDAIQSLRN